MASGQIGMIVILILALAVLCGGWIAYRKISGRVREISRMAFGTDDIAEGFRQMEKEAEVTPKSVAAATNLYLPQIVRDFPEFHYNEMKNRAENMLMGFLRGIEEGNVGSLPDGATSELKEKLRLRAEELQARGLKEHFADMRIHRTEIRNYRKSKARCSIVFQSSMQYHHYTEKDGVVVKGSAERLEQSRYNVEMIYIQDRDLVENLSDSGLALNCPNCGAPLPKLGAKKCIYCDTPILEFNIRIWHFSDVEEA